jgi:hypothetical protein
MESLAADPRFFDVGIAELCTRRRKTPRGCHDCGSVGRHRSSSGARPSQIVGRNFPRPTSR